MPKLRGNFQVRSRVGMFSYCRRCGQDTLVSKTYAFGSQIRRCAFCTNPGCGFKLEIDGYDTE